MHEWKVIPRSKLEHLLGHIFILLFLHNISFVYGDQSLSRNCTKQLESPTKSIRWSLVWNFLTLLESLMKITAKSRKVLHNNLLWKTMSYLHFTVKFIKNSLNIKEVMINFISVLSNYWHKILKIAHLSHDFSLWKLFTNLCTLLVHNDPKFLDRLVLANRVDPDQTTPRGAIWSGSTLFAIPSLPFGHITLW